MAEIVTYAPAVISTLNRYEHFKRCLESLERNKYADLTEVYIALDYPPSEKYVNGWKKIDDYLNKKENSNGFKKLYVIRRERNYGVSGENSNYGRLVRDYIIDKYDRFIPVEDDNEFSPNFLEYINQALELYKDDDKCTTVCGYNYYGMQVPDSYKENTYLSREFSGWGCGYWTKKWKLFAKRLNISYEKDIMKSWKKIWTIYKHEPRLLNTIILNLQTGRAFGDTLYVCQQYLEGYYSVFPVLSKVRNHGFDGSGTTIFRPDNFHNKQLIDEERDFKIERLYYIDEIVQKEVEKCFKRSLFLNIVIFVRVLLFYITGSDILYFEQKRRNRSLFK